MKIILAGPYPKNTLERFQTLLPDDDLISVKTQTEYNELSEGDLIIVRVLKTTAETMESKKSLRAIIRWGAGYDSVDIVSARERGIRVAVTPGANAYAVAELAVAMMLTLGRRIIEHNQNTHQGIWDNKQYVDQMTSLNHKTVGIIGGGNIGQSVATRVQAFGARTIYYDVMQLSETIEHDRNMEYRSLTSLLQESDIVTIHVPLFESTHHLIGAEQLQIMKPNAILINTARGGIVDDTALIAALQNGSIMAAGLDCVEDESSVHALASQAQNLVITPHIGGTTNDLPDEMIPRIISQIECYRSTGTMEHIVN